MSTNLIALQNKFLGHGQTVYDKLSNLHEQQGYVSDGDITAIAAEFHLPPAHVRSTAKFYEELSHDKAATHVVKVCNGEACRAAGCSGIERQMCDAFSVELGATSGDGVRVESVACLGYCGLGPNVMVDGLPLAMSDGAATDKVVKQVQRDEPHGLTEPTNAVYKPADGAPCVLMRHFDKDIVSFDASCAAGVYSALERAVTSMSPQAVIDQVKASQLRGRGGAGFPTGIKFQTVADSQARDGNGRKFVVVNFDEGDAGSYIDKELIERDPHTQLEGILIAAYACGAQEAIVYARYEYPRAQRILQQAINEAKAGGMIGVPLFGRDFQCDVRMVGGQGAYICGEETSLLRSLEGVPALVSTRPPFPAQKGLWDCPTAVNNVETLHNLPWIIEHGCEAYAKFGHEKSRGTKAVSLNTHVKRPGMYEVELGTTLRELIFDLAGGMADGQRFKAVQVGGPLGGILPEILLDTPLDFEAMARAKGILGHAGVVVYSQEDNLVEICRGLMHFCAVESCGKCFPCRIGSVRGTELFDQMMADSSVGGGATDERLSLLAELCETMKYGSLCALGGMIPAPIECLMEYFPEELEPYRPTRDGKPLPIMN
ncbi:MAG: NADH-ubiquinone oxidoreductase-F iron-sulfur binding region domain-containing protein [Phycisphaeraceae bacterium]|nr:NADH-ubiquinone oxidoreductase-F iron-sulfur binding region domain-containing protein [Phycisphaeraceae bacterium]